MSRRSMRSVWLLATVAAPAWLAAPGAAFAQSSPAPAAAASASAGSSNGDRVVKAYDDTLSPYYGNIRTFWGNIRTFWGDNTPFWGNIRTFWGDINPYDGDLTAFWGNIRTFNDGTIDTALLPAWGNIRTFAGDLGASWGNIRTFWGNIRTFEEAPADYGQLAQLLNDMVARSQETFGTAVQTQTGKSFMDGFADPLLDRYGIDLNDPSTLAHLDADTREHFIMDWWDGLMNFSGADHVDHWMKEINWTPALTQTLGQGKQTTIGILDFTIGGAAANNVVKYGGVSKIISPHGTAVASLMVDPMDGKGVMGIAPKASVVAYNPFDATMTAGWSDIKNGIKMLAGNGASVVNMSLGVPGWTLHPGWNDVFDDKVVQRIADDTVFVIAAGNDGIAQTQNIAWDNRNPAFIVVGSADPTGKISTFSNRPGTACLLQNGRCRGDYLMEHFVVAPGELMLVSDGKGGVTRMSGTSFAAPLVSGTIALIHDRWPWLQDHPNDTVDIIFKSARDLGAPGVDPVYGWGELDVQAALSPLDWNKLVFLQTSNGFTSGTSAAQLRATSAATRATWQAKSVYFTLFEDTGTSFRDFEIPMSTKLANKTVSVWGGQEQFMSYLQSRFTTWLGAPTRLANGLTARAQFTDLQGATQLLSSGNAVASITVRPRTTRLGFRPSTVPLESTMQIASPDGGFAFAFGNGGSAGLIGGQSGFAMASDYDVENGGANPFLGFASGGAFANVSLRIAPGLTASSGFTQRTLNVDLGNMPAQMRQLLAMARPYRAAAANMTLTYAASERFSTSLGYTQLHEDSAVLGMASADAGDLPNGSTTDAATLGADYATDSGFRLAASATFGRTRAGNAAINRLAIGRSGLVSTAFQMAASKQRLFGSHDHLRLTVAQPMHVERGSLDVTTIKVVDRAAGTLGEVTERAGVAGAPRRLVGELIYGRALMGGAGEVSLFGRAQLKGDASGQWPAAMGGVAFRMGF